ncbi:YrzI family small protein [Bacillus massilinigeriensis]|nr:YrzI family small protein [Bacillus massilionigeriensis]
MTLNILFFTVTIKKRSVSVEDYIRNENAERAYQDHKDRQLSIQRYY